MHFQVNLILACFHEAEIEFNRISQETSSFQTVFHAVTMKITVSWKVTPCNLVDRYQRFEDSAASDFMIAA
jgi:hypothetical protein